MPYYKGEILDITEIESKTKGTPGLQFEMELTYKAQNGEYVPISPPMKKGVWLYFPTHSQQGKEMSLKKLAKVGWAGGTMDEVKKLIGKKEVEVISQMEEYNGEMKEKFDFPLPTFKPVKSENAAMVIDQLLASSPVPDISAPEEAETPPAEPKAASKPAPAAPDDEVPF